MGLGPQTQISSVTGEGLDDLKEMILLQADVLDLRASDDGLAEGLVLETSIDKGLGPVADIIVTWGSMGVGDDFIVGSEHGKVRRLLSEDPEAIARAESGGAKKAKKVKKKSKKKGGAADSTKPKGPVAIPSAGVSECVRVIGLKGLPSAGSIIKIVKDEEMARKIATLRKHKEELRRLEDVELTDNSALDVIKYERVPVKQRFRPFQPPVESVEEEEDEEDGDQPLTVPVVLKVDSHGTMDAVRTLIAELPDTKVRCKIAKLEVGPVTGNDLELSTAAGNAPIFAFGVGSAGGDVTTQAKKSNVSAWLRMLSSCGCVLGRESSVSLLTAGPLVLVIWT